jgi:hypothetical protein
MEMKEGEFTDWLMLVSMLMVTGFLLYVTIV